MIYSTPSLNHSSQPTDYTEHVETCHTLLLRFEALLPVLEILAFPLDCTWQQHSLQFFITPCKYEHITSVEAYKKFIAKTVKICGKKSAQNTFPIFTIVWYNFKHSGMQSGTLQSGHHHSLFFSLFPVKFLEHTHSTNCRPCDSNK
jgi:hypothetical protein